MDMYKKSLKKFRRIVKRNHHLTREEWDRFARLNNCYSALTLEARKDITFEQMKEDVLWWKFS